MGVDYSASAGYGFVLSEDNDDLQGMAARAGFFDDGSDPDDFDTYEFMEWLCSEYGVDFITAGDHYSGDVYYLIGSGQTVWNYRFGEAEYGFSDIASTEELHTKLKQIISDLNIPWRKIGYYVGLSVS